MGDSLFGTYVNYDDIAAELSIKFDDSVGTGGLSFTIDVRKQDGTSASKSLNVPLRDLDNLSAASFTYDGLDRTYTLTVDLDLADSGGRTARQRIEKSGIAGAGFTTQARLSSLKVVLRPRPAGGDWTSDHPSFALIACWDIDAAAKQTWDSGNQVNVTATFEVCVGLSVVVPDQLNLGLPNFQVRLDLPALGLTTQWLPFSWFEWPDLLPLKMQGLLAWFSEFVDFDWSVEFPDINPPKLPEWDADLPLSMDLPLGIGVTATHLHVWQESARGLVVDASARDFYLTWEGKVVTNPRGYVTLHYDTAAHTYAVEARFFEAQYPEQTTVPPWDPYSFSLPFDLLGLQAECWYLGLGLALPARTSVNRRACFQALIEIGGLKVTSRFTSDQSRGFYRTDLRLLLRDTTLISARPGAPLKFFADVKPPAGDNPFKPWLERNNDKDIPALSFADDLLAPPPASEVNECGLTFLDGEFRRGERAFVLWQVNGSRLLKALGHDLLGREAAGAVGANESMTDFGLEFITQGNGATQIRLDWRSAKAGTPGAPDKDAPAPSKDQCIDVASMKDIAFNVPFASPGTFLNGAFADPLVLDLPAITLELARPATQSIVLRAEADGSHSASHLLLFNGAKQDPDKPVEPLARARIGFSLKQSGDGADERDVVETKPDEAKPDDPFLAIGLGRAQEGDLALRTVGWRRGRAPRFLEVLPADAAQIRSLIPTTPLPVPGADPGCPGPKPAPLPPAALDFDVFETPRFGKDSWRLSVRIAATDALFKMFGDVGSEPGQKVSFKINEICIDKDDDRVVLLKTSLTFELGSGDESFKASGAVTFRFDLRDLSLSIADGASLAFRLPKQQLAENEAPAWTAEAPLPEKATEYDYSEELTLLGMKMTALARKKDPQAAATDDDSKTIDVLTLSIKGGRFVLALPPDRAIVLRYAGLGPGSLNFWLKEFVLGPGGLDAEGGLISNTLRVKGLKSPFILEQATLRIRSSRLDYLSVAGSGVLPELLDEAPVKIALAFKQDSNGRIDLDSLDAQLGDKDKPIFSRGTRFKFEIQELGLSYRRASDKGERHFFFELTGSAQFTPESNEFTSGLLENLKSARLDFVRVPLTDEFAEYISLSIELKRPVVFKVFGVFRMEIRSIGFHPKFRRFSAPTAAVIIGGQVEFADTGDVIRAEIDFHAMYIGLPKPGSSVPQVYFDGLRVDISTAEGFRIGGRVDTYKKDTLDGFAGEGTVQIPGFPELSAAFAFVRVRKNAEGPWLHAWFIAIEAAKISYLIGGALPIYLRQIGLGFGYRYTLPLVLELEKHEKLSDLIDAMLRAIDKHQTLARIDSWTPETDGRRWTIALEAVLSLGSANKSAFDYNEKAEREIRTIFTQIFAAFRSDFTLVAGAKLWFPVSIDDFFKDTAGMRRRPLATGFFAFSAPQNRLLAHVRKNQDPYLGDDENKPIPYPLKLALEKSYFEATLLIESGLVHAELGWPDRLGFDLTVGPMRVGCRGGILMRIERDLLVYGYYFSAYGELSLGGAVDLGFVGVRVEALVRVQYATRLLIGTNLRKPLASNIYGAIGLDIAVRFLVRAWLRLKFKFFKIRVDISFSFSLQLSVLGEIGWAGHGDLGFRGRAQFVIGVFGRSLALKIDVGINKSAVEDARKVLCEYAGSFLEPGKPPPMPGLDEGLGARAFERATPRTVAVAAEPELPPDAFVTAHVVGENRAGDGNKLFFAWIMPGPSGKRFYPATKLAAWHKLGTLNVPDALRNEEEKIYVADQGGWAELEAAETELKINRDASVRLEAEGDAGGDPEKELLRLPQIIAGCYKPTRRDFPSVEEQEDFPRNWPAISPKLDPPGKIATGERIYDARVFDPTNTARGPRRMLDESNAFDRAVLRSIEPARRQDLAALAADPAARREKDDDYFKEQALANQSLLLQGLYDDLVRIARTTRFDAGTVPVTPPLGDERPTLFDLGMLLCVKAKELPEWLAKRDATSYPSLTIASHTNVDETHILKPAADAACIDFAQNPPVVRDAAGYFDEEMIALAWRLDWGGTRPRSGKDEQLAEGATEDIDDFLRAYEIRFVDFNTQRVIHAATSKPCDVLAESETHPEQQDRLVRYSYSVARDEILPSETAAAGRRLIATVTPISQAGTRGASFSFTLDLTPAMTPLPADDAHLDLRHDKTWTAEMRWRQPMLPPQTVGVARTAGWQLILRPLAEVPLGAYPEEAIDTTERGLMSTTGHSLIEGDVIVPLVPGTGKLPFTYADVTDEKVPDKPDDEPSDSVDDLPPPEKIFKFDFPAPGDGGVRPYFDHTGAPLLPESTLYQAAHNFFQRGSADNSGGRSWRLFLRAVTREEATRQDVERLAEVPVSGLSPVRLAMSIGKNATLRPLPYFEWPLALRTKPEDARVKREDLGADGDVIHVPVVSSDDNEIEFVPRPGRERAVTVTWNATPSAKPGARPLAAIASYTVHETVLDGLINFDLDALNSRAVRLRRIVPTDPAQARQHPSTMADTQNWEAQYPVFARTREHLRKANIEPDEMLDRWPGTYSWAESELEWPNALTPAQQAALATDKEFGVLLERGEAFARAPVHHYLALLFGLLYDLDDNSLPKRQQVDVTLGPPTAVADPVRWLDVNNELLDPYGWAGLTTLGLAAAFALRDPITGILVDQAKSRKRLGLAHQKLNELIEARLDPGVDPRSDFQSALESLRTVGRAHVMVELPIQFPQAYRVREESARLTDVGLAILQVSLRPLPRKVARYDIIALAACEDCEPSSMLKVPNRVDVTFTNRDRSAVSITGEFNTEKVAELFKVGDVLLVREFDSDSNESFREKLRKFFNLYDIIALAVCEDCDPSSVLNVPNRVDVAFANRDRSAVSITGELNAEKVAELFKVGDVLLVREFDSDSNESFQKRLQKFFNVGATLQLARIPVAQHGIDTALSDIYLTPFGRFERLPMELNMAPEGGTLGQSERRYDVWLGYLVEAFARPAPGDDAPDARERAIKALKETLLANKSLFESYRTWAARLFVTAPIESVFDRQGKELKNVEGPALATAAAQPKSLEPVRIAVDGQGKLRFTHFVKEEWATVRGYSVTWEGRYDRLAKAIESKAAEAVKKKEDKKTKDNIEEEDSLPIGTARRDVYLPRVRALEPPAILSARAVRARDGRPFNEIVAAHSERTLTESNNEVAAKLEFGDIRRRYDREFAEPDYIRLLKETKFSDDTPLLDGALVSRAETIERDWNALPEPPDLSEHDQTLLYAAPGARWGATRYQDAAEPFYYRQTVTVEATASRRLMTQGHSVVTPSGGPDTLTPLAPTHSDAPPSKSVALEWTWFWTPTGMEGLWTTQTTKERAKRFDDWSQKLILPGVTDTVVGLMKPHGFRMTARLPRYAESLSAELRDGPFAYELVVSEEGGQRFAPAGLLPDGNTRLLLADLAPGETFAAIAQVAPVTPQASGEPPAEQPWAKAFRITTLSSDFETNSPNLTRYSNWTRGLFAQIDVRPAFRGVLVQDSGLPTVLEIESLVRPDLNGLINEKELPGSGALAQLAPLAIRLVVSATDTTPVYATIGIVSPLTAPRWAFRPALDPLSPATQAPADEADLFVALRLLLDTERRRAAALVSIDSPKSDNGLLALIEESAFVYVLKHPGVESENDLVIRLIERGFVVFERVGVDEGAAWHKVDSAIVANENWKIALVTRYSEDLTPQIVNNAFLESNSIGDADRPPHAVLKEALAIRIRELAGMAHRTTAMRAPQVFAQRGNEPRVPWR